MSKVIFLKKDALIEDILLCFKSRSFLKTDTFQPQLRFWCRHTHIDHWPILLIALSSQKLLHPSCVDALEHYLQKMKEADRAHAYEDWFFQPTKNPANPTELNKRLNPKTINEILDHYALKIGLSFRICPHSARVTFNSELLEVGVDIYRVAREVNHSSVKTTQEYDKRRKKISESPVFKLNY